MLTSRSAVARFSTARQTTKDAAHACCSPCPTLSSSARKRHRPAAFRTAGFRVGGMGLSSPAGGRRRGGQIRAAQDPADSRPDPARRVDWRRATRRIAGTSQLRRIPEFAAHMQIPAGESRQGSAEKLTGGGCCHPVARQGPAPGLKSRSRVHARSFCGQELFHPQHVRDCAPAPTKICLWPHPSRPTSPHR